MSLDHDGIKNFVLSQQEENLSLDFKTVNKPDLNKDDKKNLARALSGFANSSGGLIIWGIEATKNGDGIDCATKEVQIDEVLLFLTRLQSLTGQAVSPVVDGVQHRVIESGEGKGFAVTLVPESMSQPHMAKFGEDRYYKRSGDSFYKMEHFDLEDMFGRRKKPKLELSGEYIGVVASLSEGPIEGVSLNIENTGRGIARHIYLEIDVVGHNYEIQKRNEVLASTRFKSLPSEPRRNHAILVGDYELVIHPGTVQKVTEIHFVEQDKDEYGRKLDMDLKYRLVAEDMRLDEGTITIELPESNASVRYSKKMNS